MVNLFQERFESILRVNKNWGRWSDISADIFPDIASLKGILKHCKQYIIRG